MVERSDSQGWEDFEGLVQDVIFEPPKDENFQPQWHIFMKPQNRKLKEEGSFMHEWIRIPSTATESSVPRQSVLDRFLEAVEDLVGSKSTVKEVFESMKGKTFLFKKKVLGRAFEGKPAADYFVPVKLL